MNQSDAADELLKDVARRQNITLPQMKLVWIDLVSELKNHLAVKGKPIDLGFMELIPTPYRGNWHNFLYQRMPSLYRALRGQPKSKKEEVLELFGAKAEMMRTSLLAVEQGICYFRVEVRHKKPWWVAMLRAQKKILSALGCYRYCKFIAKFIATNRDKMLNVHLAQAEEATLACGKLFSGSYRGGEERIGKDIPRGRVRPSFADQRYAPVVLVTSSGKLISACREESLECQDTDLLALPDIQPETQDVRFSGPGVGLPVLDADEGKA